MGLAQHIRVSHFLLISKCTFVAFKRRMVTLVLISTLLQPTPREGAGRDSGGCEVFSGPSPLAKQHLLLLLFVLFRKKKGGGTSDLRTLTSAFAKEPQYAAFILFLLFL